MDGEAPRGADPIGSGFEVGFDESFEKRWYGIELLGRGVMIAFVAASLAGLLGRGPLSHHLVETPESGFAVDYEPVARYGTDTRISLHLPAEAPVLRPGTQPGPNQILVHFPSALVEPMGLQSVWPRPVRQEAEHDGIAMTFDLPPGEPDPMVRLSLRPATVGRVTLSARAGTRPALTWTQTVLP
ncbi:hypothetical protein [Roseomonas indoligenes]|uniref:Uncharacterized protein n=1 Tax=Roseomonas indoligenes TaxID=2820811 RepID=A0A940N196_9PROT|nr:hypothetical protein [Pararoseomonas indoligenes]MBP0494206.1 hypothetical protein [Pararoseomonas indoligenes]